MKKRRLHLHRLFAALMLWVFAIALTPWSTLHHHEEQQPHCVKFAKMCMHRAHVGSQTHNCLICSAHFEKDYLSTTHSFELKFRSIVLLQTYVLLNASYTELIGTSLRGPPVA